MVVKRKKTLEPSVESPPAADSGDKVDIELRKAREEKGLSLADLHRQTAISRTTLHDYESGRSKPGAREIRLLCDALGVTPNRLIYGTEAPFEEKSRLHKFLGFTGEDQAVMRLAMLFQMLSRDERDAWVTLLSGSIKARVGGGEKLDLLLNALEVTAEAFAPFMTAAVDAALPQEKIAQLSEAIQGNASAGSAPPKQTNR